MTGSIPNQKRLLTELWTPGGVKKIYEKMWPSEEERQKFEDVFSKATVYEHVQRAKETIGHFQLAKAVYAAGAAVLAKLAAPEELELEFDDAYKSFLRSTYRVLAPIVSAGPGIDINMDDPLYREVYFNKVEEQRYRSVLLAGFGEFVDLTGLRDFFSRYKVVSPIRILGKELHPFDLYVCGAIALATGTAKHFAFTRRGWTLVGAYTAAELAFDRYFPNALLFSAAAIGISTEKEVSRIRAYQKEKEEARKKYPNPDKT